MQGLGEQGVGEILVAHRAQEAVDGQGAHRSATGIRGGRPGAAVDHGITDFDTGRVAIDQHATDLLLEQRHQIAGLCQFVRLTQQGRGQLAAQALQGRQQLRAVSHFDDDGGRTEDFFLKQFVATEQ